MSRCRVPHAIGAAVLVVSVLLVLAGCGEEEAPTAEETADTGEEVATLDAAQVESALTKSLDGTELLGAPTTFLPQGGGAPEEGQVGGGRLEVRSVTCPEDIPVERGGEFTCEIDGNQDGSVRLTQLDSSGEKASFKAKFDFQQLGVETTIEGKTKLK